MVLTPGEARAFYDRIGSRQDGQGFYEDPAFDDLAVHGGFEHARRVFEFGCGTGRLAARLLAQRLPADASWLGCDISPVMLGLAAQRLAPWGDRAGLLQTDGTPRLPLAARSVDRVVSTYVLDLLPVEAVRAFFTEAGRVLVPGGRLCLVGLTHGTDLRSRAVSRLWRLVFRLRPALLGGCRPLKLAAFAGEERWHLAHRAVVTPFAIPSEILVLVARAAAPSPPPQ